MKKLITTILCAALIALPMRATEPNQPQEPKQVWPAILVLASVAIGGYVILKVYWKYHIPQDTPVKLVLYKSFDNSSWQPIFTNTVVLHGTNMIEFFREHTTDWTAFYRVKAAQ